MRNTSKRRFVCLFFSLVYGLMTITGCSSKDRDIAAVLDSVVSNDNTSITTLEEETCSVDNSYTTTTDSITTDSSETSSKKEEETTTLEGTNENQSSSEKDATTEKQSSNENQTTTEKQTTTQKQTTTEKQTATQKQTTAEKQTTTQKQTTTEKQTTTQKQTTTEKQTTTQKQTTTEKQTTTTKPTTTKPTTTTQKPTSESQNLTKEEKMVKEIVDDIISSNMSDFEKAITIHDWLTFNLDYDFTYSNFYIEETLTYRTCVCQGYALTFEMMAKMSGLDAIFVSGTGTNSNGQTESHAWNQVKIDGTWYNVDVTWDDPGCPSKDFNDHSTNRYDYFLISDNKMYRDHTATSTGLHTCSSNYDEKSIIQYAVNSGIYQGVSFASNGSEFATAIKNAVESNKSEITIWYYDTALTQDSMWDVLLAMIDKSPYPATPLPSYAPSSGITRYQLSLTPLNDWNNIALATSSSDVSSIIESSFDSGATTVTLRFEPTNGNFSIYGNKYTFEYSYIKYNNGACMLMTVNKK